jgi:flagellar protein FliJ
MSPATHRPLLAVLEQAETRRDAALAQALHAEEAAQRARAQEQQLQDYRGDYQRRSPTQVTGSGNSGASVDMALIRCHHGFMQRLDQAVDQQSARRAQQERAAAAEREALLALELHVAAIGRLMQRRRAEAAVHEQRQAQRQTDEWVQTRAAATEGSYR